MIAWLSQVLIFRLDTSSKLRTSHKRFGEDESPFLLSNKLRGFIQTDPVDVGASKVLLQFIVEGLLEHCVSYFFGLQWLRAIST
jgi:hypothetical protein